VPQVQRWCCSWRSVGAAEVVDRGAQARVRAVRMAAQQAPESGVMSVDGRICGGVSSFGGSVDYYL